MLQIRAVEDDHETVLHEVVLIDERATVPVRSSEPKFRPVTVTYTPAVLGALASNRTELMGES